MEQLPFADASFDLVFLGLVLHETDQLLQALSEVARVSQQRAVILEWPPREESYGPPLAHRLTALQIEKTAIAVGFSRFEAVPIRSLVLYRLDR